MAIQNLLIITKIHKFHFITFISKILHVLAGVLHTEYHTPTHTLNLPFIGLGKDVVMTLFVQMVFGEPALYEPCNLLVQQAPTSTRINYCQLALLLESQWTLMHIHIPNLMQTHLLYNWRKDLILAGVLRDLHPNLQANFLPL